MVGPAAAITEYGSTHHAPPPSAFELGVALPRIPIHRLHRLLQTPILKRNTGLHLPLASAHILSTTLLQLGLSELPEH